MSLPYAVEPMTAADVDDVLRIEQASFLCPWSRGSFVAELALPYSLYLVARWIGGLTGVLLPAGAQRGDRRGAERGKRGPIVGYAGLQFILDEGHIMTLAVHPGYRRRGIGELLLLELFAEAQRRGTLRLTLEVRASNLAAQTLYDKYGFEVQGRRRRYYADGEDALIMWSGRLDTVESWLRLEELRAGLLQRMERDRDADPCFGDLV